MTWRASAFLRALAQEEERGVATGKRVLVEVRTCAVCLQPVIYWAGDFRHLCGACPSPGLPGSDVVRDD